MVRTVRRAHGATANAQRQNLHSTFIKQSLLHTSTVVNTLQNNGFVIEHIELGNGQPKIRIAYQPRVVNFGEPRVVRRTLHGEISEQQVVLYENCELSWQLR